jgi:acetyl-CoA C-acetyltransferase
MDDTTPVVVGVGQWTLRNGGVGLTPEPAEMMAEALRRAAADAGPGHRLFGAATGLWTVNTLSWRYANPPLRVAQALGITPRHLLTTSVGGDSPQLLVSRAAGAIAAGAHDAVLIAGAEAQRTRRLARLEGAHLPWTRQPEGTPAPDVVGSAREPVHPAERAVGALLPVHFYPLFENALRGAHGQTITQHQLSIAELWNRFAKVSSSNPHAWRPSPTDAAMIATPGPANRMVAFPYTKLMNANNDVDMAAAAIVCSAATARSLGVPADRWVFPLAASESHEEWYVSQRQDLHTSPAIRANRDVAFELAGIGIDDVAHLDLYSCFPAAVEVAADALGVPLDEPDRPLTQTGGNTFAGGPGNNYSTHALAALAGRLREDAGAIGLLTANGWFLTKHALGLYSTRPPASGFRWSSAQVRADLRRPRRVAEIYSGPVRLETYTVLHGRDGAATGAIVAGLTPDGRRAWGANTDADVLAALETQDFLGAAGTLQSHVFVPTDRPAPPG